MSEDVKDWIRLGIERIAVLAKKSQLEVKRRLIGEVLKNEQ